MVDRKRATSFLLMAFSAASVVESTAWSSEVVVRSGAGLSRGLASSVYTDSEARAVTSGDELKIREIREQEIEQLKITLSRRLPSARRADLYLRLAELYIEAYRFEFLIEGRIFEKRLEKGVSEKQIQRSRSRPYLALAIRACQEIIEFKVRYERMDQVLYFLAYNYNELGDEAKALTYFSELVKSYPSSNFTVEGYRELGEAAFRSRDYRRALQYFEAVLSKSGQAPGFEGQIPRVYHRIAWCRYRLKQYDKAVQQMKEAIRLAGLGNEKLLSVKEEALRDLAIFMTESGNVEEAITYFQKAAGDQSFYPKVLVSLGRQYERNVEPVKATQVYESLLKTNPKDEAAFRVRVKLVDLDLRRGHYGQALERIKGVKLYASSEGETETSWQNLRAMIRRTATESHAKYRKESDRKALEVAERFYEAYLDPILTLADPRKEAAEIQMYLADVKRERGLSKEASALYRKVVDSADKRYAKEAAALWTASLADAIKKESQKDKSSGSPRIEPSVLEQEFVQAADDLSQSLKDSVEAREARLKAAQVLAAYPKSQKSALKRIQKLMEDFPRSGQAITAGRLWLQVFSDRLTSEEGREKGSKASRSAASDLRDVIQEIRAYPEVAAFDLENGAKLKGALAEQESRLKVLDIDFREKDQDYRGAAKLYEKFAEEAQTKDGVAKGYENAVASWLKLSDLENADRVVQVWQKKQPDNKNAFQAARNLATLFFIRGQFSDSATVLERLGGSFKDAEAMALAVRIVAAQDSLERLTSIVGKFIQGFPQSSQRARMLLLQGHRQEQEKMDALAAQSYKQCLSISGAEEEAECAVRLGVLYERLGNREQSRLYFKKASAMNAKGAGSFFVSWAKLQVARDRDSEIVFPKLTSEGLAQDLPKRLVAFESVQKAYAPVIEAGGGFSVAASRRLGGVALELAEEMEAVAPADPKTAKVIQTLRSTAVQFFRQSKQKALDGEWVNSELPLMILELNLAEKVAPAQGPLPAFSFADFSSVEQSEISISKLREQLSQNARDASLWGRYGIWLVNEMKNDALAEIAFDRVLAIQPKSAAALNNLAVLKARSSAEGVEDPWIGTQVLAMLKDATALESGNVTAQLNRAQLLNFYGFYAASRKLLEQIPAKDRSALVDDGLGVSLQGLGNLAPAKSAFVRAREAGADPKRFAHRFHEAAEASVQNPEACLDLLSGMRDPRGVFEKNAADKLEEACKLWKLRMTKKS